MTNEEMCAELCEKMEAEQEAFRERLLSMSPEEVLEHAFAYCTREDILIAVQMGDFDDEDVKALLKSETPLADIYDVYVEIESDYMDVIRNAIDCRAEDVRNEETRKQREEER